MVSELDPSMATSSSQPSMASQPVMQSLSTPVSIKLDDENFHTWKQQALGTIKGFRLQKFISEAQKGGMPKKFSNDEDEELRKISFEYENWEQQDQLILTWLLASMSPNLHTRMVGYDYAYQIWKKIEVFFASQTRAKVSKLKTQIKNVKKVGSLNEYLLTIKKIVDTLAAVGSPIDDDEHIQVILDGLPDEYDSIVASILSRTDPYTIQEIEALMMAIEERIEKHKKPDAFGMQDLQANLVQSQSYKGGRGSGN